MPKQRLFSRRERQPQLLPFCIQGTLPLLIDWATLHAAPERIALRGSDAAVRSVVELAEKGRLDSPGNPFLGIRNNKEWLFENVPFFQPTKVVPGDLTPNQLTERLASIDVLIMTATERETDAVLAAMTCLPGETSLLSGTLSIDTYTLGVLGRYAVAHCQSGMGSTSPYGAQYVTADAIREVAPKVILCVGIAFGMRRDEQRLGDVLVARNIVPYEMYKLQPHTIAERGSSIDGSVKLSKWMQERTRDWSFLRADGSNVRVFPPGDVVSGEKLVNNVEFRDWLRDRFPAALGGEMEGVGAYTANKRYGPCEILLVKAICDWADGCKNDRAQPFAAEAAVRAVEHVLKKEGILLPLGINAAT